MKLRITEPRLWYGWMLAGLLVGIALAAQVQIKHDRKAKYYPPISDCYMTPKGPICFG